MCTVSRSKFTQNSLLVVLYLSRHRDVVVCGCYCCSCSVHCRLTGHVYSQGVGLLAVFCVQCVLVLTSLILRFLFSSSASRSVLQQQQVTKVIWYNVKLLIGASHWWIIDNLAGDLTSKTSRTFGGQVPDLTQFVSGPHRCTG